jgi:hypothetical protein
MDQLIYNLIISYQMSCILLSASSIELKNRKLFWLHNLLVHGGNDLCCNLIVQDRFLSPIIHRFVIDYCAKSSPY